MLALDHIAVLGESLEEAAAHLEAAVGTPLFPGGRHNRFGTQNRLLGMAPDLYIEAIAVDPAAEPPSDARWFGLDHFSGPARLDKWICRVEDMASALDALPMAGEPIEVSRGGLSWTMAVPKDGVLAFDGLFPALIQWHGPQIPGRTLPKGGIRLKQLTVSHPDADVLRTLLAPHLSEPLIRFETAAPGLAAELETPLGEVQLT